MLSDGQTKGVLIVDDSESDIILLKGLFASKDPELIVRTAMNEQEFTRMIQHRGSRALIPNVDIVVLDLNMPKDDGVAVLKKLKSDPDLRTIPVIVFSGSESQDDVKRAYELGANSYLVKPVSYDELSKVVGLIDDFWLHSSCLPHRR